MHIPPFVNHVFVYVYITTFILLFLEYGNICETVKHFLQALQAQLQDAQTQGGHTTREALLELQERLHRKNDELLAVEAKNAQLEAQKAHAEDQVLTLQADLEQAQQGVAEAKREVKSSRAATRAKRAQEVPQGLVVRSLDMLSKGEVVWKLCAANGKWQERFMAVTPGPPAAPESLKWSKDAGRRKLRRPSSVGLQEIVHVGFGAEALPARHKAQVTKPWCCFSVWTAQRSFHFKAESELIAENFVLGLSRLCPGTKPTPVRDVVLHRALGKMGPDAKSRAAALSKALRAASASASAAQGLGEPDRVTHGEEEEEVHFARLGTALSEVAEGGEEEEVESELATDDELNSATKIGSGPKWSAEHGPLLSGSLNKYLNGGHPGDGRLDGRLGRRGLLGACVMGLDQLPAAADVIRLQQAPLPQAYRDSVVPTAQALKEALEAEESVGDAFIGEEAEKTLSALEQKAGQLVQRYGETYIAERGLPADAPLRSNQVYFLMEDAIGIFEVAVQSDQLPKARQKLIAKLQEVLDLAAKVGIEES
ncbi:PH domain-containing protein [Durusdinium trenchii]|uniref:PH domain-containing protein n=1 Tax=Durusdinium trenchii TaxID=1381693 RepID=A0ABP0ST32_9DINO